MNVYHTDGSVSPLGAGVVWPRPQPRQANLSRVDHVRVTGVLAEDATVRFSLGAQPHAWLVMTIVPARGIRYHVRQDLGTDPADHMNADTRLVALRRGALVSATGKWLRYANDHGHEVLVLEDCTSVITHAAPPADIDGSPAAGAAPTGQPITAPTPSTPAAPAAHPEP